VQAGVQYDNSARDTIANVQVSIPLNIVNRNQGGIQRAQQELIAAQTDVARTELELQHRLAVTFERYETARQQVDRYGTIRGQTQEYLDRLRAANKQAKNAIDRPTLLLAQRRNAQAQLAFVESLRELRAASVVIDGMLLTGSLQQDREARGAGAARDAFKPELSTAPSELAPR
jgi:cobalt-zinc-cadmium efflux system outer membrane protein